jgi:phosphohistidine phosphatase SixA
VADDRLAPGATAEDLRAAADGRGETVVVVGHQPDCSEIVLELTGREVRFPPGGVQELEL